jgi:hypothetical protein
MRLLPTALLALAALALAGCDSADDPDFAQLLPEDARYTWSLTSRIVESDSLLFSNGGEVTVRAVSRDASVPGYRGLTELETATSTSESRVWYELTAERLRQVAAVVPVSTPPATPRMAEAAADVYGLPRIVADLIASRRLARSGSDSLVVRDDPRVVYELPLEVGSSWVSFTEPFGSTREVVGREAVTVAAGTFDCFVIRTEIDVDYEAFEWLDYVSPAHGLVLRTMTGVQEFRGPDNPPGGELFRVDERLELIAGD